MQTSSVSLSTYGCTSRELDLFSKYVNKNATPVDAKGEQVLGRVISLDRGFPLVFTAQGTFRAEHATSLYKNNLEKPTIGDWVVVSLPADHDNAIIEFVLERKGCIARREGTRTRPVIQVLAANVNVVFIVEACNFELNPFDLAKRAVIAYENDIEPVFVFSKFDELDANSKQAFEESQKRLKQLFAHIPIICESAKTGDGIEQIRSYISAGKTAALLGRSGVGKSTLVNALAGRSVQKEGDVRATDNAGRHTTVARNLVLLETGGMLVDMPGLRSFALLDEGLDYGIETLFPTIAEASRACKFRDCTHTREPGCAVREALAEGAFPAEALELWHRLKAAE